MASKGRNTMAEPTRRDLFKTAGVTAAAIGVASADAWIDPEDLVLYGVATTLV